MKTWEFWNESFFIYPEYLRIIISLSLKFSLEILSNSVFFFFLIKSPPFKEKSVDIPKYTYYN